ncbi:Aspartate-tRNA(Asp/Asn) ligase [Smittium culicis]|uniref:Aspartate-tRNA(Asp/Asn) ligase n=1 Tax=Smittium culicis TaxID=133412 RepID=A0A1R1XTU8_9FUNG|nr:Aspartate-tRNA(Asp/Asn) ligase [Smittium culicis]
MVSGFDRYYQIAKCFRDEDLRADRQPEFTQVDIEMSFVNPSDIQNIIEGLMAQIWKKIKNVNLKLPFKKITFNQATSMIAQLNDLNSSHPDHILEVLIVKKNTHSFNKSVLFKVFDIAKKSLESGESESIHIQVSEEKYGDGIIENICEKLNLEKGDTLFVADRLKIITPANTTLGRVRAFLGSYLKEEGAIDYSKNDDFLWVEQFPLFTIEDDLASSVVKSTHHPFTSPDSRLNQTEILKMLSESKSIEDISEIMGMHYDLVLNGVELGGGSIRIHNSKLQSYIFSDILNISDRVRERLNHLVEALSHGSPPHGGIALGLDRLVAILVGANSLRDVIAFPKAADGRDLMLKSPAIASPDELLEYNLIAKPKESKS